MTVLDPRVTRTVRRAMLLAGAGALGAAVCSAGVGMVSPPVDPDPVGAPAGAHQPPRTPSAAEQRAIGYLRRAVTAERTATYSGTKWLSSQSSGGAVTVVEVRHDPARGTWLHVRTAGAARPVAPGRTFADTEGADLDGEALAALSHHYTVAVRGTDHSAGRPATVVEASVLGTDRVAGRFWLDRDTGLLLRRELYDPRGGIVRATVYVELDTGTAATPLPADARTTVDRAPGRVLEESELAALRRTGWQLPDVLPGGMERYRTALMTVGGHRVVQVAYSDGIFAGSLFVEEGRLDADSLAGFRPERMAGTTSYVRDGLHRTLVWAGGTAVYTLVLDAPEALGPRLVAALPHRPVDDSVVGRLGRGIHRVGSWANPFD